MKIAIILCHPLNHCSGELREAVLVEKLNELVGVQACLLRPAELFDSNEPFIESDRGLKIFAVDSADPNYPADKASLSSKLLNYLGNFRPDVVFIKGMGYKLTNEVVNFSIQNNCKLGFIIGGEIDHQLILDFRDKAIFFQEYQGQIDSFNVKYLCIADKYIDNYDNIYLYEKDIDILNIGNFDEERKNQEFLFPFFSQYRVKFIGDGARLNHFKALSKNYPSVTYDGFLQHDEVIRNIARSRLLVHTSRYEGLPRCIMESIGVGVPVVWYRTQYSKPPTAIPGLYIYSDIFAAFEGIHQILVSSSSFATNTESPVVNNALNINKIRDNIINFVRNI